jgi:hypothetical protein
MYFCCQALHETIKQAELFSAKSPLSQHGGVGELSACIKSMQLN